MRPPVSAVPEQPAPHSEASPHVNNLYGEVVPDFVELEMAVPA